MKFFKILIINIFMIALWVILSILMLAAFGDSLGLVVCTIVAILGAIVIPILTKNKNDFDEETSNE